MSFIYRNEKGEERNLQASKIDAYLNGIDSFVYVTINLKFATSFNEYDEILKESCYNKNPLALSESRKEEIKILNTKKIVL